MEPRYIPGALIPKGYKLTSSELKMYQDALYRDAMKAGFSVEQVTQLQKKYHRY